MQIISKSVLMLFTKNYQNKAKSMLVETIQLAKVGAFFETQCRTVTKHSKSQVHLNALYFDIILKLPIIIQQAVLGTANLTRATLQGAATWRIEWHDPRPSIRQL